MKISLDPLEALAAAILLNPSIVHQVSVDTRPETQLHSFTDDTYVAQYDVEIRVRCSISTSNLEATAQVAEMLRRPHSEIVLQVE